MVATVEEAVSVGMTEGTWGGSMMTMWVEVEVRPDWSPACAGRVATC